LPTALAPYLLNKGFKVKNGSSHKFIQSFIKSWKADNLFGFLKLHPSNRAFFNSVVKSGNVLIDPSSIHEKLRQFYEISKTSSVYVSKCSCGAYLDRRYLFLDNFELPSEKQVSCPNCSRVHILHKTDYEPVYDITFNDLIKLLNKNVDFYMFLKLMLLECIYCNSPDEGVTNPEKVNLLCKNCHQIRVFKQNYYSSSYSDLIVNKQGYWFEWYVWRQLKDMDAIYSQQITEKSTNFEFDVDVCLMRNGELLIIECKDTKDVQDTLANLHLINKVASKFFLVSTQDINKKQLAQIKSTLGEKFTYIPPKDADNINFIVGEFLKSKPKQATLPNGF
jgi:hypothetical protein